MLLNTNVLELTTAATDGLLAVETIACVAIFRTRRDRNRQRRTLLWKTVFLLMAAGALLGVVTHGIALSPVTVFWVWQPLYLSIGLSVGLFAAAAIVDSAGDAWLVVACATMLPLTLAFYVCTLVTSAGFSTFVIYEALCLSMACILYLRLAFQGNHGAAVLALGIGMTLAAAGIQASKAVSMTLGSWPLNHNGVFHLIQMPAVLLIALGIRWFNQCDVCRALATKVSAARLPNQVLASGTVSTMPIHGQ